jgi:UDP-glucose 4-epimerase
VLSEDVAGFNPTASQTSRDLIELELLAHDFAVRNPACRVARLRLGYRISRETTLGRFLSLPLVPTFAGYDPRLQFLHEEDAAEAIAAAALGTQDGPFNVARMAIRSTTGISLPGHLVELLMHGSVIDCSRLHAEFGWQPVHSSRAVMDGYALGLMEEPIESPSPPQEYELQVYLQRRRRGERNGHGSGAALAVSR